MTITATFDRYVDQIGKCDTCEELARLAIPSLNMAGDQVSGIQGKLDFLAPLQELATLSITNPTEVLTFVQKLRDGLIVPQVAAYATYITQAAEIATAITSLTTAIADAQDRIGSCSLSLPDPGSITLP